MTTQAAHSFDTALADQRQHTASAQALADDYKTKLDATRREVDALAEANIRLWSKLDKTRDRYESAMLQIRDAHGALFATDVPCEAHESHDGCATQLGHRVRLLAAELTALRAVLDAANAQLCAALGISSIDDRR